MSKPHNILIILSDEQRYDTLGCTGNSVAKTPHLDELAESGTVFDRCYTPFPLCCPARTSLWTSRMARNHHVIGNWRAIRPELRDGGSISDFAGAGYHTIYSGKWHVPGTTPARLGFADCSAIPAVLGGMDRGRYIEEYRTYAIAHGYELVPKMIENLTERDMTHLRQPGKAPCGPSEIALEHYIETWQTEQFLAGMERRPDDTPFFAAVSYSAPHFPMIVPEPYDRLIRPEEVDLPINFCADVSGKPEDVRTSHYYTDNTALDEDQWRRLTAHYWGFCSLVDTQVGKILRYLRVHDALDNTIVVYLSDHGDMMGSHGMFMKGHPMNYEEINHVPAILHHPDVTGGRRIGSFVSLMDVIPTLADMTGVTLKSEMDGLSAAPLVNDPKAPAIRESVTAETFLVDGKPGGKGEYIDPGVLDPDRITFNVSLRTESEKYIFHSRDDDELYDLVEDPGEMTNLAQDVGVGDRIAPLKTQLIAQIRPDVPQLADIMVSSRG